MSSCIGGFVLRIAALIVGVVLVAAQSGCAAPARTSDADSEWYTPRVYRTGSNIPVKDYDGANIDVAPPDIINPVNRPMGTARPVSGG